MGIDEVTPLMAWALCEKLARGMGAQELERVYGIPRSGVPQLLMMALEEARREVDG